MGAGISAWDWWLHTEAGLMLRICIGAGIFVVFAIIDLVRNRDCATRWREYLVLLTGVCIALLYGVINDLITSSISWEYFYYGKELEGLLGAATPPARDALTWEAMKVGMKATWGAGLIAGAIVLIANNPWRGWRRLSYPQLLRRMLIIPLMAALMGALGGLIGYAGGLTWTSADFADMLRHDIFRPRRFMCTFGVHLGGYVGALIGLIAAVIRIIRERRRAGAILQPAPPPHAEQSALR